MQRILVEARRKEDKEYMDIKIGGIYKHFKGDYYLVEDVVYHSETKEKMVLYRALYANSLRYEDLMKCF